MKKLFFSMLFFATLVINAQTGINYKVLIKDGGGTVLVSQSVTVQFSILEGAALTNVYQETHTTTTDANGFVILNIGEGTSMSGDYSQIAWGDDEHFLNVQINSGAGLTDMGTTQFMAVPYAKFAENSITKIDNLTDAKAETKSVFVGENSGNADDGNNQNTALGFDALKNNINGLQNVAIGESTLLGNISGDRNTVIGQSAMRRNTTGSNNTAVGEEALYNNTSGQGNIAIGQWAGRNENDDNKLYIDNSSTSDPLIWGDFTDGNEKVKINGNLEVSSTNTSSTPSLNLIHEGVTGARINFSNTDTTNDNLWTLYGDTNDIDANSIFNIFHSNTGNIVTVKGDGKVNVNGDLTVTNTTKIGTSGAAISEVIKLTGTTYRNAVGNVGSNNIPYPSGYNWENTYVVSFKVKQREGGLGGINKYTSLGNYNSGDDQSIYIDLRNDPTTNNTNYIQLNISDPQYEGAEYVLILMKID